MLRLLYKTLLFVFLILLSQTLLAQSRKDLENKKKKLQEDIELKNNLLKETTRNRQLSLSQLVLLNKKISSREELIYTIRREIKALDKQIEENRSLIKSMEEDLKRLKDEYAQMVFFAYKNKNAYDRLMFIFSSKDFNQAYKRLKYFQQYSDYRKKQVELIVKTQEALLQKQKELEDKKKEKEGLLQQEQGEKNSLYAEKQDQQKMIRGLQDKEKKLKDDIKKTEQERAKLQKAIQRIIEEEMAKAKESGNKSLALTPEAMKLSADFQSNKAKLPWPVEKGILVGSFGEHPHPVLKGITVKNNGVDISTAENSSVRAVFGGEITGVIIIPGAGKALMVRHGEYLSVYANLKEVFVQKGDKVSTKQEIGKVMTDETDGKTEVHFEIWKGQVILDPATWLYKAK